MIAYYFRDMIKMASSTATYPLFQLRSMFYLITPNESSYEKLQDVPNYIDKVSFCKGLFFVFLLLNFYAIYR